MASGVEAKRIKKALTALGVPREEIRARTTSRTWREYDPRVGRTRKFSEPTGAYAHVKGDEACALALEGADKLTEQGLNVDATVYPCGCVLYFWVRTRVGTGPGRLIRRPATPSDTHDRRCPTGKRITAVRQVLTEHPLGDPDLAKDWTVRFNAEQTRAWLEAGCTDPIVATFMQEAGITPERAAEVVTATYGGETRTGQFGALAADRHVLYCDYKDFM